MALDAFDVLLVPTSGYADARGTRFDDADLPVDERVDLLAALGLRIDRVDHELAELVMAECEPKGMSKSHRQWGSTWGFFRDPAPQKSASEPWAWDPDLAITSAMALSRLVQPNVVSTQYAARVVRVGTGGLEVHPGPVSGQSAAAWVHLAAPKRWLSKVDAEELAALMAVYWPVKDTLPRRLSDALWKHETIAQTRDPNVRLMLVITALEGVVQTDRFKSSARFGRLAELGAELGVPFSISDAADAVDLWSHVERGARLASLVDTSDDTLKEQQELRVNALLSTLEEILRKAVRRGIEDPAFRGVFADPTPTLRLQLTDAQVRQLDAAYEPFPTFATWARSLVDGEKWAREAGVTRKPSEVADERLRRALDLVRRAAAIDTGAIEGLYAVERGFTFTAAMAGHLWQLKLDEKGPEVRGLIEAQFAAYDLALDLATKAVPIAEAFVRGLHEEVCRTQETYKVQTAIGPQNQPLTKGAYKAYPNHVRQPDSTIHSYCPVDFVSEEMHRLVTELQTEEFQAAHPVLQASFAHYALVAIHPFADGNGRVARLLASVFLCRAHSIPFLLLADEKDAYFRALGAADRGDLQSFVSFTYDRGIEAFRILAEAMTAVAVPAVEDTIARIRALYTTKGGYSHADVDDSGTRLLTLLLAECQQRVPKLRDQAAALGESGTIGGDQRVGAFQPIEGYRLPNAGSATFRVHLSSRAPAAAEADVTIQVEVPKNCGADDDIIIRWAHTAPQQSRAQVLLRVAAKELLPLPRPALQMRLIVAAELILAEALVKLHALAEQAFKKSGYWNGKSG